MVAALVAIMVQPLGAGAAEPRVVEYQVTSSLPVGAVCEVEEDRHGKLWVEQYLSSQIGRFDLETKKWENFNTPSALSVPGGMDEGPDGNLWFPNVTANSLTMLDTDDGKMTERPFPWANALDTHGLRLPFRLGLGLANDIAKGADGKMYFTLGGLDSIGSYDTQTGKFEKFRVPGEILGAVNSLIGIMKPGPGRSIIFDVPQLNKIAMFDIDNHTFKQWTMPTPLSLPVGNRTGKDGTIWVSEGVGMKLASLNPKTGKIVEYPLLGINGILNSVLSDLKAGSVGNPLPMPGPLIEGRDGNIYFMVSLPTPGALGNKIARFNPKTKEVKMWHTPSSLSSPCDLNQIEDGSIVFGELTTNKIGRLILN